MEEGRKYLLIYFRNLLYLSSAFLDFYNFSGIIDGNCNTGSKFGNRYFGIKNDMSRPLSERPIFNKMETTYINSSFILWRGSYKFNGILLERFSLSIIWVYLISFRSNPSLKKPQIQNTTGISVSKKWPEYRYYSGTEILVVIPIMTGSKITFVEFPL